MGTATEKARVMSKAQVIEHGESTGIVPSQSLPVALTPIEILSRAVTNGSSVEVLEKLMGLQERWEKNQARKAFDEALSAAKAEIPVITKNRQVGFDAKKPGASRIDYRHEDLAEIARTVDPILSKHGLSYRWRTTSAVNEPVTVTCIVSHRSGHSEENTLSAGRDDTGNKNSIQQVGSTITYLQRYTLKAALGLAASNDDDGRAAGAHDGPINDKQTDEITALITETKSDIARFLKWAGAESVSDIPASKFSDCVAMLKAKKQKGQTQ
jgi:ERF superfamily